MDWRWTASPGVALAAHDAPPRVTGWARAAERAGLGSVWIIEDYFQPGAFALAGAAAAATERIAVGLGVVNPYTRHPALLAMEAAALAGIAGGRVVLGLGSSNRRWIEEQMGIAFRTPLAALRETVEIVRRLLAGERLTFRGRCFTVEDVALEWAPKAPPPVLLGVKGPQALRLAGEVADGVHCSALASPAHVRRVRQTAAAARGDDFRVVAYVVTSVDDDGPRARAAVRPVLARYLGLLHGQSILEDAGLPADRTRPFRDALLRGAPAVDLVDDAIIDAVAVAGTPDQCARQLARWAEAGLDTPIAVVPPEADVGAQLAAHARTLVPAWREITAGRPA
jgi:5,10-methylenetetrahydromethanopterin reductase